MREIMLEVDKNKLIDLIMIIRRRRGIILMMENISIMQDINRVHPNNKLSFKKIAQNNFS